jgi:formylglycine-generating enzyme required for sulfatase activity
MSKHMAFAQQMKDVLTKLDSYFSSHGDDDRIRFCNEMLEPARKLLRDIESVEQEANTGTIVSVIVPQMVEIPAGAFRMGDLSGHGLFDQRPVREVVFARPFALGKYAVTFDEYDCFAQATGRKLPEDEGWGRGRRPVINVSWHDATAYCQWLSEQTGQTYRLPSEAEWEYACRAGTTTEYSWGDEIGHNNANYDGCGSQRGTTPVGSFAPNPWGLYDMHGNVWELCADCWNNSYRDAPSDGSARTSGNCAFRVLRGGSWCINGQVVRAAYRYNYTTSHRNYLSGFRVAMDL